VLRLADGQTRELQALTRVVGLHFVAALLTCCRALGWALLDDGKVGRPPFWAHYPATPGGVLRHPLVASIGLASAMQIVYMSLTLKNVGLAEPKNLIGVD
jgi:hypothetical protein